MWWSKIQNSTTRFDNLSVVNLAQPETKELAKLADCSMQMQVNIQEGEVMISVGDNIVYVNPTEWKPAKH